MFSDNIFLSAQKRISSRAWCVVANKSSIFGLRDKTQHLLHPFHGNISNSGSSFPQYHQMYFFKTVNVPFATNT
jgi:hypothetical protein